MTEHPIPDRAAARTLGAALRRLDYSEAAVHRLLGDEAFSADRDNGPADQRRLPSTRLGTVVRALFLQLPVPTRDAVRALGKPGVRALETTALADVGENVVPRARVLPVGTLLLAADGFSRAVEDPPDYVAGYTPTARLCDSLTPRPTVSRALDVGTGSGIHALLAATHARRVVATDVNPRALAYTTLNAALNGLDNIECRAGSLFEPVSDELFDLITCNAPYVVSPERRWTYRDGGLDADQISEQVVREAASRVAEGGFATLLVSWVARSEGSADDHAIAWAKATGCDSWILPGWSSDPLGHAAAWNSHLASEPDAFGETIDEWTRYFARLGVGWVSEGAVLLHRRAGRRHTVRVDDLDEETLENAGDQILRAFAARAHLARLGRQSDLLDARLSVGAALRIEHDLEPGRRRAVPTGSRVALADGTGLSVGARAEVRDVIAELDGRTPLGEIVKGVAERAGLPGARTPSLCRAALKTVRELLEIGALRVHP